MITREIDGKRLFGVKVIKSGVKDLAFYHLKISELYPDLIGMTSYGDEIIIEFENERTGADEAELLSTIESILSLPEESQDQPISEYEMLAQENASILLELASTQAQLKQTEQAQADLLLQLVEKGVI